MELTDEIMVQRTTKSRLPEVDILTKLGFGTYISDHMLICYIKTDNGKRPVLFPLPIFPMPCYFWPCIMINRYLKGLKAFRLDDGRVNLFRSAKALRKNAAFF